MADRTGTHRALSIRHQCALIGLPRSQYYYTPASETSENLALMRLIDEQYLRTPSPTVILVSCAVAMRFRLALG